MIGREAFYSVGVGAAAVTLLATASSARAARKGPDFGESSITYHVSGEADNTQCLSEAMTKLDRRFAGITPETTAGRSSRTTLWADELNSRGIVKEDEPGGASYRLFGRTIMYYWLSGSRRVAEIFASCAAPLAEMPSAYLTADTSRVAVQPSPEMFVDCLLAWSAFTNHPSNQPAIPQSLQVERYREGYVLRWYHARTFSTMAERIGGVDVVTAQGNGSVVAGKFAGVRAAGQTPLSQLDTRPQSWAREAAFYRCATSGHAELADLATVP